MKHLIYSLLLMLFLSSGLSGPLCGADAPPMVGETKVVIVQTDKKTLQTYYITTAQDSGTEIIGLPIGPEGDYFDMWVRGTAWDKNIYLVDSKVVSPYNPTASFVVDTQDPWIVNVGPGSYVKRTRADYPFSYKVTVGNLSAVAGAPTSAKEVRLDRRGVNYDVSGTPKAYTSVGQPLYMIKQTVMNAAGEYDGGNVYSGLTGGIHACGEERFEAIRWADMNGSTVVVPETTINQVTVQIWPVASAAITGVTPTLVVLDAVPPINVQYTDLYPDSYTYTQVYKGPAVVGKVGKKLTGSERPFGEWYYNQYNLANNITDAPPYTPPCVQPQNKIITELDLDTLCDSDGVWTVEVVTETVMNRLKPEILAQVTFVVDRKTLVRGQISTGN